MSRTEEKQLYAFELDDYSAPSCTSFTKLYFGTIADFRVVVEGIGEEYGEELRNTFERFVAGEQKITYHVAYSVTRFARFATLITEKPINLDEVSYQYSAKDAVSEMWNLILSMETMVKYIFGARADEQ